MEGTTENAHILRYVCRQTFKLNRMKAVTDSECRNKSSVNSLIKGKSLCKSLTTKKPPNTLQYTSNFTAVVYKENWRQADIF